jgi:hypothetical protein
MRSLRSAARKVAICQQPRGTLFTSRFPFGAPPARARRWSFLNVTPIRRKKRLIVEVSALTPRSDTKGDHEAPEA